MTDLGHLDEAGFTMTLPTTYRWFPRGHRLRIPYQASEGRRVNAIGAYITHGPGAGRLLSRTWASLPKSRAKRRRKSLDQMAAAHGLTADEVGPIDSERLVTFIWEVAGRPQDAPSSWQRERPLMLVLDNYSVHKSQVVATARPRWRQRISTWSISRRTVRNFR